jgi:photosystem II stability/assembly factor-like uncharacterized protein
MRKNARRIFILIISIALVSLNFQPGMAGDDVWTTQGPFGLRFFTLIIDPANPDILYAFTIECDNIGVTSVVFKSLNGGVDWFPSGTGIPLIDCGDPKSNGMVMDPSDSNTLYVANELGIYKTTDGAQSWTQITDMRTSSLAISPHGRIFAGVYEAYGYSGGIYRSDDGGSSWEMASVGLPSQVGVASALAIAPGAPYIIYAGIQGAGLYKSLDNGDTWQSINSGFFTTPQVRLIAVDPYDSQVVYFSALAGLTLFRSDNGGASWQPIGEGLPSEPFSLVIDPGNQQVIYAGTWGGVYRSLDNLGQKAWAVGSSAVWRSITSSRKPFTPPPRLASGSALWFPTTRRIIPLPLIMETCTQIRRMLSWDSQHPTEPAR